MFPIFYYIELRTPLGAQFLVHDHGFKNLESTLSLSEDVCIAIQMSVAL